VVAGLIGINPANAAYVSTAPPAYNNGTTTDPQSIGSITLYDASGNAVTSGQLSNLGGAIYAVASNTPRTGAIKAQLSVAAPDHTKVSSLWASQTISGSTLFTPVPGTPPTVVSSATGPVVTLNGTTDGNISSFLNVAQLDTTSGYQGYLQLRVKDSCAPTCGNASTWATMEIAFDAGAGTWQQVYPVAASQGTTASTPTPSLASPQNAGTAITLSSTATPTGVAGTMTFYDYGVAIAQGTAVAVDPTTGIANTASFAPTTGDHDYTAVFTPTTAGYTASPASGDLIYSIVAVVLPPTSQTSVSTTGAHVVDQTLTCVNGTWSNNPTSFAYSWLLNSSTISGQTSSTLRLTATMVGKLVSCRVTARNTGGTGYDDSPQGIVVKANFVNKTKPAISGVLKVGKTLTASTGTWTPAGTSYTYVWKRGTTVVGKAKTYKATAKDKGKTLTVTVTAVRAGYNNKAVTSLGKKIA
jgi:hypothetical protein